MHPPLITLTTDFGTCSPFVAAMKGVIYTLAPQARVIDLGHEIPPFSLAHAAFFLAESLPYFPAGTVHVVVIDPEVGTARDMLAVRAAGHTLLVPDNGCWTLLAHRAFASHSIRVRKLANRGLWRDGLSNTFHGRDILAPVAAHLARGVGFDDLGPEVTDWRQLPWPDPIVRADRVGGEVVFVDRYGNCITNIPGDTLPAADVAQTVRLSGKRNIPRVRTYGDAAVSNAVSLVSSAGYLEIAVVQGSAAATLGLTPGMPVVVSWGTDADS